LTGVTGLDCEHLRLAKNWEQSIRDPELECSEGGRIPDIGGDYPLLRRQALELIRSVDAAIERHGVAQTISVTQDEIEIGIGHNRPPSELVLAREEMREARQLLTGAAPDAMRLKTIGARLTSYADEFAKNLSSKAGATVGVLLGAGICAGLLKLGQLLDTLGQIVSSLVN
jgi:hypothetical protein